MGPARSTAASARASAAPAEGRNDFGAPGYRGPCPPPGKAHRYVFPLYALDAELELGPSDRRLSFDKAVEGHVLATAELDRDVRRDRRRAADHARVADVIDESLRATDDMLRACRVLLAKAL